MARKPFDKTQGKQKILREEERKIKEAGG